jgi:LPXTG-motif cell wall-anchored protein
MIKAINSKTLDNIRDGVKDGMETAWKASKRMQFRSPVVYDRPSAAKTGGWIGLIVFSAAALALGAWLYFRKRKQVADHYTMGEGPGPSWEADKVPAGEQLSGSAH